MRKIAFVVQRYGKEVNGGAELHCKILAEELSANYQIEVLTTTAIDYQGWENHYNTGDDLIDGIKVKRFSTIPTNGKEVRKAKRKLLKKRKNIGLFKKLGLEKVFTSIFPITEPSKADALDWVIKQGPYSPDLISYIKANKDQYDCFIFFTYLYYPTVIGLPEVKEKSILIPTAHDEPIIYTIAYQDLFSLPKFIMYNTAKEKEFVEKNFRVSRLSDIAGLGFRKPFIDPQFEIKPELKFDFDYFIYIGRIDADKGCNELVQNFKQFAKNHPQLKLVMVGKNNLAIKNDENIVVTGFINEAEKNYLLSKSIALIIPSQFESLSMVTLEAMAMGIPVVANGKSEVLSEHINNSKTGKIFTDYSSFENALNETLILNPDERESEARKSQDYVAKNYSWETILSKFSNAIELITTKH